jgi:hypothetical protein
VLLVNLAKGSLGEDTANLLGSLLISRFDLAALSRANRSSQSRSHQPDSEQSRRVSL